MTKHRAFAATVALVLPLVASQAHAALLSYSFSGIAGAGSILDVGSGPVDVTGAAFTASGVTINDVDLFGGGVVGDGVGAFAATTTYDFGILGAFSTNAGGDFYLQNCAGPTQVNCALLATLNAGQGFRVDFTPAVVGDPDFGIPLGTQLNIGGQCITRTQSNASGDTLTLGCIDSRLISVTVTAAVAAAAPEPATLVLLGLGLAGLGWTRRRK